MYVWRSGLFVSLFIDDLSSVNFILDAALFCTTVKSEAIVYYSAYTHVQYIYIYLARSLCHIV